MPLLVLMEFSLATTTGSIAPVPKAAAPTKSSGTSSPRESAGIARRQAGRSRPPLPGDSQRLDRLGLDAGDGQADDLIHLFPAAERHCQVLAPAKRWVSGLACTAAGSSISHTRSPLVLSLACSSGGCHSSRSVVVNSRVRVSSGKLSPLPDPRPRRPSSSPRSAGWSTPCTWPRNRARRNPGRLHRDRLARPGYGRRRITMPTCARSSSPRPSSRSRRRVRPNASPRSPATSAGSLARRSRSRQRATVAKPCSS